MGIHIIIACDINNGIAKNGKIPWNIKQEMAYFKRITQETLHIRRDAGACLQAYAAVGIPPGLRPGVMTRGQSPRGMREVTKLPNVIDRKSTRLNSSHT